MKITIATPTFGIPTYLKECIESVKQQSLTTLQIVYGGNLLSPNDIEGKNIKIINKDPDPGMVTCWNMAASLTNTQYIGFLADDNSLQPDFSKRMVSFMQQHPTCEIVFCNQNYMNEKGLIDLKKSEELTKFFGRDLLPEGLVNKSYYKTIIQNNSIPLEACLIRRSLWSSFGPFKEEAKGAFDQEFLFRILLSGAKIGFIPDYLMNFRLHKGACSSRQKKEHLIGTIWTSEALMNKSQEYYSFFRKKNISLKGRLLRFDLSFKDRVSLLKCLFFEKNGVEYIIKNSIIRMLFKINLSRNLKKIFSRKSGNNLNSK